jgi:hypothetical protein
MMRLVVRVFAKLHPEQGRGFAERVRQRIELGAARARVEIVRQYWKIPEYQEIQLEVLAFGDSDRAVSSVTLQLGTGWNYLHSEEAVWNPGADAEFFDSAVRWANVEALE